MSDAGPDDDPELPPQLNPRVLIANEGAAVSDRRRELRRLAAEARRLIEGMVGTDADDATITSAADDLRRIADAFHHDVPRSLYDGLAETAMAGVDGSEFFDHSPLIGRANPLSPPVTLEVQDDVVLGHVRFGSAYEGPPGCVHGGYIAAAFDEILGSAQTFSGHPGMTGQLTIRYRKPTPLYVDLRIEGRFDRIEGRKVFTVGQLFAGDVLTAEAEGLFISIDPTKFRALLADRDERLKPSQDG